MTTATYTNPQYRPHVVRLRAGRVVGLLCLVIALGAGAGFYFLRTYGKKVTAVPPDTTSHPSWMSQSVAYAASELPAAKVVADPTADLLRQVLATQQKTLLQLQAQQEAIDALKRRPAPVSAPTPPPQPAKAAPSPAPAKKPGGAMLFVSHDLKEGPTGPPAHTYTLAAGKTKIPCLLETRIISDVEGVFTCVVTTNIYDTATGRHLLIPQGATVLGNDHANELLYGSARMNTKALALALPDGRSIDLGHAPVTDQQGVTGLTGDVNNHFFKLFGAVIIGGALKGGMSAFQLAATEAAGAGQVTAGLTTLGNQATTKVVQPYINIRPTITIEAGEIAHVILVKPLDLPAMWQAGDPTPTTTRR